MVLVLFDQEDGNGWFFLSWATTILFFVCWPVNTRKETWMSFSCCWCWRWLMIGFSEGVFVILAPPVLCGNDSGTARSFPPRAFYWVNRLSPSSSDIIKLTVGYSNFRFKFFRKNCVLVIGLSAYCYRDVSGFVRLFCILSKNKIFHIFGRHILDFLPIISRFSWIYRTFSV